MAKFCACSNPRMFRRAILLPADGQRGISLCCISQPKTLVILQTQEANSKTRVAKLDDVAFATPPSPKSGKLCPIVTQFRDRSGYFDSDPQPEVGTTRIPRAGHAQESCLWRNKASPQSPAFPYAPPTNYLRFQQHSRLRGVSPCVFIDIPALPPSFPQRSFVFIDIPA